MFSIPPAVLSEFGGPDRSAPHVRMVIPSLSVIEGKLKWMIELSPDTQLRKQWKKLKRDFIDAFTDGVDESRPACLDVAFSNDGLTYDLLLPIADLTTPQTGFLDGLRGRNYVVKKVGEYEYELQAPQGHRAHLSFDKAYARIVADGGSANKPRESQRDEVISFAQLKKDVVVEIINDSEGRAERRTQYEAFREQFLGQMRLGKLEGQNAFRFRKLLLNSLLIHAGDFLVDTGCAHLEWTIVTSSTTPFGRGEVSIRGLPATELEQSIQDGLSRVGHFANLTRPAAAIASTRLSVPLGPNRIRHVKELLASLKPILKIAINSRAELKIPQQQALERTADLAIDMLEKTLPLGSVDAVFNLFSSPTNKPVMVCAIRVADGKQADQIAKLLSVIHSDWRVKLDTEVHAGVSIHQVEIGPSHLNLFQSLFPGASVFYVGTTGEEVWCAAGENALRALMTAIDETSTPASDQSKPKLLEYYVNSSKVVSMLNSVQTQYSSRSKALTPGQRETRKDAEKYLKVAKESMSSCEATLDGEVRLTGEGIVGTVQIDECTLKCLGAILAATIKDLE